MDGKRAALLKANLETINHTPGKDLFKLITWFIREISISTGAANPFSVLCRQSTSDLLTYLRDYIHSEDQLDANRLLAEIFASLEVDLAQFMEDESCGK